MVLHINVYKARLAFIAPPNFAFTGTEAHNPNPTTKTFVVAEVVLQRRNNVLTAIPISNATRPSPPSSPHQQSRTEISASASAQRARIHQYGAHESASHPDAIGSCRQYATGG